MGSTKTLREGAQAICMNRNECLSRWMCILCTLNGVSEQGRAVEDDGEGGVVE